MKLEDIGFYTLCDARAANASATSPMWRCEMILTDKCNFNCAYCRGLRDDCKEDMPVETAQFVLKTWIDDGLKHVRFSGGEPTFYKNLDQLIIQCVAGGVARIAISTNGSRKREVYDKLIDLGVNDFSISLDACCATDSDMMAGGRNSHFDRIVENIKHLSEITYVTVGVVLTDDNIDELHKIVEFAHDLGVADIRIISAAQSNETLSHALNIRKDILEAHPILNYRVSNMLYDYGGRHVRGLNVADAHKCHLLQDDSVVCNKFHFPCVIYMRELGEPIGEIHADMREDRMNFYREFNPQFDPICKKNCLDVCIDYNNRYETLKKRKGE